ncbi:hypothetical protein AWC38_SpisGene18876 [Stylophora pistillata]|uniref:Uncharacterized protein n=1 Tax=Stylophora pistillata TaxID=50429 RepID=A0A2B4RKE8_STYPI|nr:hypothetical protein AWC38_SpisGene18876 [Stylophora pistillata]
MRERILGTYVFLLGAPSSGFAKVIIKDHNNTFLGSTQIFYFPDENEVESMVYEVSQFESFSEEMISHTANSFDGGDGDPQRCGAFGNAQQVQFLCLLVYTAARKGAQQFIEMIFSTSAGRLVFSAYKDSGPLPEVVARDHGHNETACYLEDVAKRYSEEISASKEYRKTIDWSELAKAAAEEAQRKHAKSEDQEDFRGIPIHKDGSSSDYFADTDNSSCGSVDGECERSDSKGEEPTEKEASSLAPPVEPSSEETAQFDQAKGKEKKRFWFYAFYMFVLFSDTLLMCISIFLRILTGFMLESHTRRVLYRRVIPYCTQNWDRVVMCTIMLLSLLGGFMPEGWRLFIVVTVPSFFLGFFLKRSLDAYLSSSDAVEGKFKNSAVTVPYILHESDNSDEAELETCDPRPPIWPKRRRYPRLSALDARRKSNPKVFDRALKPSERPTTKSDSSDETECDTCDLLPPMRPKRTPYPSLSALHARRKSNPKVFDGGREENVFKESKVLLKSVVEK